MMRFIRRSKALDDFIEGIRPELAAIPTPVPTEGLKARVIGSRAAGVRTILPAPETTRLSGSWVAAVVLAAALVVLLIPTELRRSRISPADVTSPGVFGNIAYAQAPRGRDRPHLEPVRATAASRFRAVSLEFERRIVDRGGRLTGTGNISLGVSPVLLGDVAAWRVISIDREPLPTPRVDAETAYVARADLRLLRRAVHVAPYSRFQRINVSQQFSGDSIIGRMTTDGPSIGAGRAFARELPSAFAPFMTGSAAPVFLMAVPLSRDWRGSASLVGWAVRDNDVLLPIELRVESGEMITVPAGRFDCWRLSIRFRGKQIDYWVRKTDGLGVKILDSTDAAKTGTRELVLRSVR
jgi:hypothetical protein